MTTHPKTDLQVAFLDFFLSPVVTPLDAGLAAAVRELNGRLHVLVINSNV
jgi:hypothetical protein